MWHFHWPVGQGQHCGQQLRKILFFPLQMDHLPTCDIIAKVYVIMKLSALFWTLWTKLKNTDCLSDSVGFAVFTWMVNCNACLRFHFFILLIFLFFAAADLYVWLVGVWHFWITLREFHCFFFIPGIFESSLSNTHCQISRIGANQTLIKSGSYVFCLFVCLFACIFHIDC